MQYIIISIFKILFVSFLLHVTLFANLQNDIEDRCFQEYTQYKDIVSNYLIRMEDDIYNQGCFVIPIYANIIESENFDILDAIEDDPDILKNLNNLLQVNKELFSYLFKNNSLKKIIINNSLDQVFMRKFTYLIQKSMHSKNIKRIKKNPDYLNYYILASVYGSDIQDSMLLYRKLRSSISIELMPSFVFVLSAIGEEYSFKDLLENFATLDRELSTDMLIQLAQYPEYFVYFIYPDQKDLGIEVISNNKLRDIQKDIQKKVIFIYKSYFEEYTSDNGLNYALLSIENLYPYILNQYDVDYEDFTVLFAKLIDKDYLLSLFSNNPCSQESKINFAVFGNDNIQNIIKFWKDEKSFARIILEKLKENSNPILALLYISNFYNNFDNKAWKIFKDLLITLPKSYDNKIAFLKRIEQSGYFQSILVYNDYEEMIKIDYSDYNQIPKYKYILITPFPNKDSTNLFNKVIYTNISDDELRSSFSKLVNFDKDDLEKHEFTLRDKSENILDTLDTLDNAIMVVSIVAAPFTGGVSLSYVAIKTMGKAALISASRIGVKYAGKKVAKYAMKKSELLIRKTLNKSIRQARKARKVLDNQIGIKNRNNIGNSITNVEKYTEDTLAVSRYLNITKDIYVFSNNMQILPKDLCQEIMK